MTGPQYVCLHFSARFAGVIASGNWTCKRSRASAKMEFAAATFTMFDIPFGRLPGGRLPDTPAASAA